MQAIQIISQDLFDKVRSRFSNLEMGDETGAVTIDPAEARFFDFDFVLEGNNLGRVSISLNDLGSLKVYYSQGITENQDDPAKQQWYSFLREMRFFAMRRLLRFDTRDIAKTNLDKNDFQHLATTQGPKEEEPMNNTMNESRWNQKSTKKTSRAVRGQTEVIVRHDRAVDEMYPGARSQKKNIKAIFIQNHDGERFKYPFIHPAGAFAMAQHVDHGGIPHDQAGKAIIKMSEQIAQLQEFQRKIHKATLHDDATGITERALGRLNELKARVESLGKRHHYQQWMAEFNNQETMDDNIEMDSVTMEQYKQKFTQTNFQEELAEFFPLLHRIMSETNSIDLEDYVQSEGVVGKVLGTVAGAVLAPEIPFSGAIGGAIGDRVGDAISGDDKDDTEENMNEFAQFEEWAEAVEQGKLANDQIEELKNAIMQLPQGKDGPKLDLGPDGQTAIQFFQEFGLNDSDLEEKLKDMANVDSETDALEVFKIWANEDYPELAVELGMSDTGGQPEAGAEQPVAEGPGRMVNGKEIDMRSLEIDGVNPRDYPDFSDAYISYALFTDGTELNDQELEQLNDEHGDLVHELAYDSLHENEEAGGPANTMMSKENVIREVAKLVKSRFNEDNPDVGPFNGKENIALDVKKKCAEMFGDQVGEQAEQLAMEFMEKLSKRWEEKHGHIEDDGLARLKELLGNVKSKVESMGDVGGHPGNNIMSAEADDKDKPPFDPPYKNVEPHKDQYGNPVKNVAKHLAKQGMKQAMDAKEDILRLAGLTK